MKEKDKIKDLFHQKLSSHHLPVSPEMWQTVSTQIKSSGVVGTSILTKTFIGLVTFCGITTGLYFIAKNNQPLPEKIRIENTTEGKKQPIHQPPTIEQIHINKDNIQIKKNTIAPVLPENEHETTAYSISSGEIPTNIEEHTIPDDKISDDVNQQTNAQTTSVPLPEKVEKEELQDRSISVDEEKTPSFELARMPNVYSLHSAGHFSIEYRGEYRDFQLTILNEKNQVVFSSHDPTTIWQGIDPTGNLVQTGTYFYIVMVVDINGQKINKYSPLQIIP